MAETNPYLALLQERPRGNWMDLLSNALLGVGSGISQASSSGQGWGAGIAPGLMLGNQMTAQAEHAAEQERMRRFQFGLQAQEWDEKRAERLRKEKGLALFLGGPLVTGAGTDQGATTPGITAPQPSPVKMGPDLVAAGTPVVNYLTAQHGFSPLAAATVAGNLYQESSFNPGASGDGGTAFGMAQWRLDRQDKLKAYAASQQKPVTDPQVQLDYLVSEMKGGDMGAQRAYAMLQQAKTPEQANAAMMHFFRPQGYTPANPTGGLAYGQRVANTRALLPRGGPSDATYAPVPGMPDPDEAPALPAGPAPRPGLGPRATPGGPAPDGPAPDGVPLAQGGGEGEVVLPRIGLPFPARPPAAAPPGSVPFQPQYTPTPATPSMAPGGIDAPPTFVPPPVPRLDPQTEARINAGVAGGIITPEKGIELKRQIVEDQYKKAEEAAKAQHATALKVYEQQQESRRHQRGLEEQKAAEERRIAAENARNERDVAQREAAEQRRAEGEQKRHDRDAAERQAVREDAAKQSGDKLSFEQTKAMREDENKIRDDFNGIKQVQDFRKADLVFQSAQKAAKTDTKAADLNLVYAFATMMDPGSVVRDQETGMVVATQGASDRVKALVASVSGKSGLSVDAKKALIDEMRTRHSAYKESHDAFAEAFEEVAKRRGLDPRNVVTRVVVEQNKEEKKPDDAIIDVNPNGKRK